MQLDRFQKKQSEHDIQGRQGAVLRDMLCRDRGKTSGVVRRV